MAALPVARTWIARRRAGCATWPFTRSAASASKTWSADMVRSRWVYRKLRNFRAGIEAGISCLKRAYGLARCTWRGLDHFKAYVWSSVVAYNLALFVRLRPG